MCCRIFSNNLVVLLLDARKSCSSCDNQNYLQTLPNVSCKTKLPPADILLDWTMALSQNQLDLDVWRMGEETAMADFGNSTMTK